MFQGLGMMMGSSRTTGAILAVYAKWNSADKAANISLSNADLTTTRSGAGPAGVRATVSKTSGKWYWEIKCISTTAAFDVWVGLANATHSLTTLPGQSNANGWAIAIDGGDYYNNGFIGVASGTWGANVNDVFGFAWDAGANTIIVYRNNTALTPNPLFSTLTGTLYPVITTQNDTTVITANFGASTMAYTAPSGYNQGLYS